MKRILISGGGTGGHIFPAISIADAMKRRYPDAKILFVGALGRMEMERVPAAGYEIIGLPVAGFDRKRLWRNFKVLWKLNKSIRMAKRIVREFKPDIAIGVGGYASGPTLKAAQKAGVPTLIQEQNSYPGVTNKLLAPNAGAICTAYEGLEKYFPADKIILTGNPVRKGLSEIELTPQEAKKKLGFDPSRPLLLVVGGSLGARTINEAMAAGMGRLLQDGDLQILWQTGRNGEKLGHETTDGLDDVVATPFISDMAMAYRAADLVVSRAGAGTISELQLLGKPVILIPSPNVAEDHQRHNAEALADNDAAVMILDAEAVAKLPAVIRELINDPGRRATLAANILKMAQPQSDERIADQADKLMNKNS